MDATMLFIGLAVISAFTTLTTEGIKKLLDEAGKTYAPNLLAAVVAVILTIAASICYVIFAEVAVTGKVAVEIIAMIFLSFLCATVGFDKVKQTIQQLFGK